MPGSSTVVLDSSTGTAPGPGTATGANRPAARLTDNWPGLDHCCSRLSTYWPLVLPVPPLA